MKISIDYKYFQEENIEENTCYCEINTVHYVIFDRKKITIVCSGSGQTQLGRKSERTLVFLEVEVED